MVVFLRGKVYKVYAFQIALELIGIATAVWVFYECFHFRLKSAFRISVGSLLLRDIVRAAVYGFSTVAFAAVSVLIYGDADFVIGTAAEVVIFDSTISKRETNVVSPFADYTVLIWCDLCPSFISPLLL